MTTNDKTAKYETIDIQFPKPRYVDLSRPLVEKAANRLMVSGACKVRMFINGKLEQRKQRNKAGIIIFKYYYNHLDRISFEIKPTDSDITFQWV